MRFLRLAPDVSDAPDSVDACLLIGEKSPEEEWRYEFVVERSSLSVPMHRDANVDMAKNRDSES